MDASLVFRTLYVDHDVDAALRAQAAREDVTKGEMCRRYLSAGMKRILAKKLAVPPPDNARLSLRTVYLPVALNSDIQGYAWELRTAQTQLMRYALRTGMEVLQRRPRVGAAGRAKKQAGARASAA